MKDIRKINKKRIELYEIQQYLQIEHYNELVQVITNLINEGVITPIKNSKLNGKKPALFRMMFHKIQEEKDSFPLLLYYLVCYLI